MHKHYPIASALNGQASGKTADTSGLHRIAALYGEGCDPSTYFMRRPQGVVKNFADFMTA